MKHLEKTYFTGILAMQMPIPGDTKPEEQRKGENRYTNIDNMFLE
jgi:hypothetical protein